MDGFAEANHLLSTALEQLDDILSHSHRASVAERDANTASTTPAPLAQQQSFGNKNSFLTAMEAKRAALEEDVNGNGKENEDGCWDREHGTWSDGDRRGSTASSGAESPPTDLPTSSASSTAIMSPFEAFVKAIDKHEVPERPSLATQLKIMRWMRGCEEEGLEVTASLAPPPAFRSFPASSAGASNDRGEGGEEMGEEETECVMLPQHLLGWETRRKEKPLRETDGISLRVSRRRERGTWPAVVSPAIMENPPAYDVPGMVFEGAAPLAESPRAGPPAGSSIDSFELGGARFGGSASSSIYKDNTAKSINRGPRPPHYSDSGFGSALSSGSSCSYLPPPPPYRYFRPSKQHRIHRSFSDSKYSGNVVGPPSADAARAMRGVSWSSRISLSPSPSMSTVSCPEYPELQDKLQRLAMARDSLSLQVSVLSEQVSAQKEKIRDLESLLTHKRGSATEDMLHERLHDLSGDSAESDTRASLDLMAEVSSLKQKFASMEREKNEAERKFHLTQSEMDHLNQSMHGMSHSARGPPPPSAYFVPHLQRQNEEVEQLRDAVQRLMADNEAKNAQISHLRNALEAQHVKGDSPFYTTPTRRWEARPEETYDFNAQLRKLLIDGELEQMAHSSSYPISLCSSQPIPPSSSRSAVQSSSSFNSSLSAASPPTGGWCAPSSSNAQRQAVMNSSLAYRSPSSPAARQLAAELDELRRVGPSASMHSTTYSTASLPRNSFNKAQSTLTLPGKKLSLASSTGECGDSLCSSTTTTPRTYRSQVNRWLADKLRGRSKRRAKRAASAPNLVESDDEVTRGRVSAAQSTTSVKPLRRDRTRSSLRNLFSKFARSNSQDQAGTAFRRGSAARSTSAARLGSSGPLSGPIAMRPPYEVFVEWRGEQLAEWIGEIGYAYLAPTIAAMVRSGRQFVNMSNDELERDLGIRNPLHRKRILLILRKIERNNSEPIDKWDMHQVLRWLEEIGLPQYKDVFTENTVDGPMLLMLTAADMVEMRITSALHYSTIARSIERLKRSECKMNYLFRKFDPAILSTYPSPEVVSRWSHAATCEWLQTIDLAEFTPNLLCAGVPGALMVYEPCFTAETLAEVMQMPAHKTLLRRHLTTHFNQLIGQKIVAAKRDFLAQGVWPSLTPATRIKVVRKGFSLTRKKAKGEVCVEPEELLPNSLPPQLTLENGSALDIASNI